MHMSRPQNERGWGLWTSSGFSWGLLSLSITAVHIPIIFILFLCPQKHLLQSEKHFPIMDYYWDHSRIVKIKICNASGCCLHNCWLILQLSQNPICLTLSPLFCLNNTFALKKTPPISSTQQCELNPPPFFWNLHCWLNQWLIRHNIVGGNIIRSHQACNLVRAPAIGL